MISEAELAQMKVQVNDLYMLPGKKASLLIAEVEELRAALHNIADLIENKDRNRIPLIYDIARAALGDE